MQQGFLLTRQSHDTPTGTQIVLWLKTLNGPVKLVVDNQQPVFFVAQRDHKQVASLLARHHILYRYDPLTLSTFDDVLVGGLYFQFIRDHNKAFRLLKKHNIELFEDDVRLENRFLIERFVHAGIAFVGNERVDLQFSEWTNVKLKPTECVVPLTMLSLDIECSMQGELYSIGLQGCGIKRVLMIGNPEAYDIEPSVDIIHPPESLQIFWVENEKALLQALELHLTHIDPDIIIGWNVVNFDFKLLLKRAELHKLKLKLGRDHQYATWRENRNATHQGFVTLPGRVVIDGIDALKTATYHFDSFSLESVAQTLLERGKKIEDVTNRVEHITHDFNHNKLKLAEYNLEDCQLVTDIFNHTQILDFLIFRSQLTGLELDRVGGSVAAFTHVYLPKLHRAGYVAPNLPLDGGLASPGGYVMNSKPGLYDNVLVLDFKSLYPSIIRTYKIDPLGLIEGLKSPDSAIEGFKGAKFSRDKHFLPDIIDTLWQQRDQAKRHQDAPRSQAIKILMNSFYGVLGSGGCRFYDTRLASSITMRGHEIMQQTATWIEAQGYDVIYGDTDSTFVWLKDESDPEKIQKLGNELAQLINQKWQDKLSQEFDLPCYLEIEFETHFRRFLMPTIRGSEAGSKKRYAGTVIDKQGNIKLVFKGLETVRSDWTALAKEFQLHLYELVFSGQDPRQYIQDIVAATLKGEKDHLLAYRKRLRRNLADYVKNVPPQVKAARMADEENKKRSFPLQYQNKAWVEYVITTQGPQTTEYKNAPLDYQHYIDKQLLPIADGILPFIDLSFQKVLNRQLSLF
ncbi:DNA polymerase II [Algibacillus agarilyticus]|uniref:DNA polymerase II n=1 Tax=Algibacillus agarilyticus TaxID=2234133 RepID=UPI000DD01E8A|nr:DNA polymerase II [Algibacillus agarilyticus]